LPSLRVALLLLLSLGLQVCSSLFKLPLRQQR
jgi:hypothetical protein